MSQKKLITRTGKGQKLTVQEMDGNLNHLEDTGLGINRGKIEPSDVDFSEIKNQFINKGDVSVSLGDTEITHDVVGFSSDGLSNYVIVSDESSDIQSGDVLTISGDESQDFEFSIIEYQLESIIVDGEVDLLQGSQFEIVESDVEVNLGIQGLKPQLALDGNMYTDIIPAAIKGNAIPSNITSVTITGDTVDIYKSEIPKGHQDPFLENSEDLGRLTNKWQVGIDWVEDLSQYYLAGLNVTLTGTYQGLYDGTYQIFNSRGGTIFIYIETPLPQEGEIASSPMIGTPVFNNETGEVDHYTMPTLDFMIPSNNGTYQIVDNYEISIRILGAIRQFLTPILSEDENMTQYPSGDISYIVNFSGTYSVSSIESLFIDNVKIGEGGESISESIQTRVYVNEKSMISSRIPSIDSKATYTVGSNNGSYVVSEYIPSWILNGMGDCRVIRVEESVVSKQTPVETSIAATWTKSTIAEFSWIHAVLGNGIVIWEAYDNNSNEQINGYWLAMKQNGEGEWKLMSHLKMTESFWYNWFNYTVKDPNSLDSVKLVAYDYENGARSPWENNTNVAFYHCTLSVDSSMNLSVVEDRINLEKTWMELWSELSDINVEQLGLGTVAEPWWNSNDDWYGMQFGERMGNVFQILTDLNGDILGVAGVNMLNGETSFYNTSEINFPNLYINNINSHPKFGLVVNYYDNNGNTYLYSPNFSGTAPVKLIAEDYSGNRLNLYGSIGGGVGNWTWDYSGKYLYQVTFNSSASGSQGYTYYAVRTDVETGVVEYSVVIDGDFKHNPHLELAYTDGIRGGWSFNSSLNTFTQDGSFIVTAKRPYDYWNDRDRAYIAWRNDEKKPKLVKIYGYPNNLTDKTSFNADMVWSKQLIVSAINTYKNNTF